MLRHFMMASALLLVGFSTQAQAQNYSDNYNAQPFVNDECNYCDFDKMFISVEGLYWKTTEDNLDFAFKDHRKFTATGPHSATILGHERGEGLDFRWKPGIRVGIDYLLPCENWDAAFVWTHLVNNAKGKAHASNLYTEPTADLANGTVINFDTLKPTFLNNLAAQHNFSDIHAHWKLTFNNYEWNLGRSICVSECFLVRPYAGLKYVQIRQRYKINYADKLNPANADPFSGTIRQEFATRYYGFGIQGGLDFDWQLGCGFSLYSNLSGGITYGHVRTKAHLNESGTLPDPFDDDVLTLVNKIKFKNRERVTRPNVDCALGLQWQYLLSDCYLVTLKAGWEYHHYFDQNFLRLAQDGNPTRGSLAMHGVTFGAGLDF